MRAAATALLLLLAAAPATATPLEDRLREQLRAVTTQLRDLQAQQSGADAGRIAAEKERDALKAKLAAGGGSVRELAAARSQSAALGSRLAEAEASAAEQRSRADALATRLAASESGLAEQRQAAATSAAALAASAAALTSSAERNMRLVTTGRELVALHIKRYGRHNFPPLQLLRTRIENEAQGMGDRITVDAIVPAAGPTVPQ
ncbi:hypothetical protein [Sandarakinorhabdus sp.]|uniref:hypothetical protein n=1 Tax=Sandarakinorhabdus sp. TaxID=1916663 RepID=UPI00286DFB09|nr:hypothetical protein [Sandarakinorhabdus sp.]